MKDRRVVVTGAGTVNPLGNTVEESWGAALAGKSGVAPIALFDASACPVRFAAEVKNFQPTESFPPLQVNPERKALTQAVLDKETRKFGRYTQLGLVAGIQAYRDSGLDLCRDTLSDERMGVNVGVGMGGLAEIQAAHEAYLNKGYRRITPFLILQVIPNLVSGQLSVLLNLKGPNHCNVTACATSAHSIGESFRLIQQDRADVMLAGGAESVVCELGVGGFASMRALSERNESPAAASRPFDRDRDGFVVGEGATVLVLEEYERAKQRGAKIYGEIVGYGATSDAFHVTLPAAEGEGSGRAMRDALKEAQVDGSRIGHVNAHATSTPAGDTAEAHAIARWLGNGRDKPVYVSSTKSMTGHLLGAAGATEALFSLLSLRDRKIPPTINLDHLDPDCESSHIRYVANTAVDLSFDYVMSNSFGFGSTNGCLIFRGA